MSFNISCCHEISTVFNKKIFGVSKRDRIGFTYTDLILPHISLDDCEEEFNLLFNRKLIL